MSENELRKLLQEHKMNNQAKLDKLTERMNDMIKKKSLQVRRIRRVVVATWILFVCLLVVGAFIETFQGRSASTQTLAMIARAMLLIAGFLTVSWYVRSVDIRFVRIQAALSTIQDGLDTLLKQPTDKSQN
jgi:F0F1-type ATP synthase assembly protein I